MSHNTLDVLFYLFDNYSDTDDISQNREILHGYLEEAGFQNKRIIKTVSLTSGSGAANISISRLPLYKQLKASNPKFNTFDFRVMQYREFF